MYHNEVDNAVAFIYFVYVLMLCLLKSIHYLPKSMQSSPPGTHSTPPRILLHTHTRICDRHMLCVCV